MVFSELGDGNRFFRGGVGDLSDGKLIVFGFGAI